MPTMRFIYGAMDKAKNEIATNLVNGKEAYKEIWKIIDEKWEMQLHRHLHAAVYYLNPRFQYSDGLSTHIKVKIGLMVCMEKLIHDGTSKLKGFAIKVLNLTCSSSIYSKRMPARGFIYGAMDKAKKEIATNLGNEKGAYKEIWKIIDKKWEKQLHRHLYAVVYYLNP
ncbi:hypothetical protein LWI29_035295 [Acer saccharum]|uniref:Uncharacterized protein n=1 Tax=Acer saccharum TaxID=4024 RepID=A0AA39RME9_ACESA|nr:hypothetical protein LWI29_035295 [Acer saccharum]